MTEIQLYLIRHAQADQRGSDYPDDSLRPLIDKGHQQAKMLAKALAQLDITFDRLFSSPLLRAWQTAEPLQARLQPKRSLERLATLADDHYQELIEDINTRLAPTHTTIACIGHEPYLSELASLLLVGTPGLLNLHFRKAAMVHLQGPLEPGNLRLEAMLTARTIRALCRRSSGRS